jgi:hypothetical protein
LAAITLHLIRFGALCLRDAPEFSFAFFALISSQPRLFGRSEDGICS